MILIRVHKAPIVPMLNTPLLVCNIGNKNAKMGKQDSTIIRWETKNKKNLWSQGSGV